MLKKAELTPLRESQSILSPQLYVLHDHTTLSRRVIKFLADMAGPEQQSLFDQECKTLMCLLERGEHSQLMPILGQGRDNLPEQFGSVRGCYYVMPYYPAGNLAQAIRQQSLDRNQIIHLMQSMVSAIKQLHQLGWLHLDIKPSNFLLNEQFHQVILSDFALARPINIQGDIITKVQGTPAYMSPEQFHGVLLNEQADYYALGLVFYEMMAGEHPFCARNYHDWAVAHCQNPVPLLPTEWCQFQPLIDGLLAKDRQRRISEI